MKKIKVKYPLKYKVQYKLQVGFPLLEGPRTMSSVELNKLLSYLKKMSNDKYKFCFQCPDYMEVCT